MYRGIESLKAHYFLTEDKFNTFYLSLPPEGVDVLRAAPSRGTDSLAHSTDYPYHPSKKGGADEC